MNNEKEIEEMAELMRAENERMYSYHDGYICTPHDHAVLLYNSGYGNVQQAVRDFAEKLKESKNTICIGGRIFIEVVAVKAIDTLITELYGADE